MTDEEAQHIFRKYEWTEMLTRGYECDDCPLKINSTCYLCGIALFGTVSDRLLCPSIESIRHNAQTPKGNKVCAVSH